MHADDDGWPINRTALGLGDHPQNGIHWQQARDYCAWVGGRLPSAAEWERAASGRTHRRFPWGDRPDPDCDHANYNHDEVRLRPWACDDCVDGGCSGTWPVGTLYGGISPVGALDMAGNVHEWVRDCWHQDGTGAPLDGSAWVTDCSGTVKGRRGGSYRELGESLRTANNSAGSPNDQHDDGGGRCARDLP